MSILSQVHVGALSHSSMNDHQHELFTKWSKDLDDRYDQRERVYKLSRDLTRFSKKVIFILQRPIHENQTLSLSLSLSMNNSSAYGLPPHLLRQARAAQEEVYTVIKALAQELNADETVSHRLSQQYSFGLQEYIESITFMHYLTDSSLLSLTDIESLIKHHTGEAFHITPLDYLLGIADMAGELMRYATNNMMTLMNTPFLFSASAFLSSVYIQLIQLESLLAHRGVLSSKLNVWKECQEKIEKIQYRLEMRQRRGGMLTQNMRHLQMHIQTQEFEEHHQHQHHSEEDDMNTQTEDDFTAGSGRGPKRQRRNNDARD